MINKGLHFKKTANWLKLLSVSSLFVLGIGCSEEQDYEVLSEDTSSVLSAKLNTTFEAEDYDSQSGIQVVNGSKVGYIQNGDWIKFDDFEHSGATSIKVSASSGTGGGTIQFRKGSPTGGNLLAEVDVSGTGGWNNFQEFTANITGSSSNSDLYVVFTGGSGFLLDIDSFEFKNSSDNGNSGSNTNLALEGSAEQSSTNHGGSAARAIDGNTSGIWNQGSVTHTANELQPWWQVRLDNNTNIEQIVIWNRTNCCSSRLSNFDVFVYNVAGTQVYKTTIVDTPNPSVTINTGGVNGNRVRIKLKGTNPLSLAEVQVFGEASSDNGGTDNGGTDGGTDNGGTDNGNSDSDFPGELIGLTTQNWKLNGFDDTPGSNATYEDDLLDAINRNFTNYSNPDYFYAEDGYAWFKCYRGLGGSANSSNPRVELRELLNGDDSYVWDGDDGKHVMEWTVRVDQLPQDTDGNGGVLCFGQIHGPSDAQGFNDDGVDVDDTIRVQFIGDENQSTGNVRLKISGYITEKQGGSVTLDTAYQLDRDYDFRITMEEGKISVDVDNEEVFSRQLNTSGDTSYFKVGNYLQSVKDASFTGSYGLVGIKNLSVTHPNSSHNK